MDNFALRQALRQVRQDTNSNQIVTSRQEECLPSVAVYRSYVNDPNNKETFVSTSSTKVTTAPKTFFDHTIAFIFGSKSNAQEAETLYKSIAQEFGPHIANYAFPNPEREQAGTSSLGGYIQQAVNTTLATALNPTLKNITLDVSVPNPEDSSPALPFLQRQIRPVIQSTVQELNPALKGLTLDVSLPTKVPTVGVNHQLVQQVIGRADALVADKAYVIESALTIDKIINELKSLNEVPSLKELTDLHTNISGLAEDLAAHNPESDSLQVVSALDRELSTLLKKAATDIPKTIKDAYQLLSETKSLASLLRDLEEKHNYYELGSSSPIKLKDYNFEQFLEPATALLTEETALATTVIRHLCNPLSSANKGAVLDASLSQNARITRDLAKYIQQVFQLKEKLKTKLTSLRDKAKARKKSADEAISKPSLLHPLRKAFFGQSWEEERTLAQEELDFATTTLRLIEDAENEALI